MTVQERYDKTIRAIEERAADPYASPQDIAEDAARANALIVRDLAAAFKFLTGNTLRAYISERKMMASYRFLIQGEKRRIEQALEIAGYRDQPGYTKAFARRFHMTPGEAFRKKDRSLCTGPLTWDALSREPGAALPAIGESAAEPELTRFGIPEAQYRRASEAAELEAFYDFPPLLSQYAFELADRIGKPLKESFRFVDSFRDFIEPAPEAYDWPEEDRMSPEEALHEYGDDPFVQRMFFERGVNLETIDHFQSFHDATEEELLECDPEMLAAYSETCDMSFRFFMRAWRSYLEHTEGEYDPERFAVFLEAVDSGMPIETALEEADEFLTEADLDYREDGYAGPDDESGFDSTDMDAYTRDEGRLDAFWDWEEW